MALRRDGSWMLRLDGLELSTDDLLLEDCELAERVCGIPWTLLNPLATAKEAKALLVVLLVRHGVAEDAAQERASKVPMKKLATAFTYVEPDAAPALTVAGAQEPSPPPVAPSSVAG
jgi:hypothetical protein